jgi:hypothetical protein
LLIGVVAHDVSLSKVLLVRQVLQHCVASALTIGSVPTLFCTLTHSPQDIPKRQRNQE